MKQFKIILILLSIIAFKNITATIEYLDSTFGTSANGIVITNIGATSKINGIANYPNNQFVVTGSTTVNNVQNLFVARYNLNGTLDSTFGNSGIVTTLTGTSSIGNEITVDSSNNIIVVGFAVISGANNVLISRYLPNGTLDLNFGVGGKVTKLIGTSAIANSVIIDANNNILVAGTATVSSKNNLFVTRYHSNGTIDTTFGTSGVKTIVAGNGYSVNSIAIDQSSKIVVGGSAQIATGSNFLLARLTVNGATDSTFGTSGVTTTAISGATTSGINSIFVDSSNRIVVGGFSGSATNSNFTVARYKTNGTLDTSFGSHLNGIQITTLGSNSLINSVVNDSSGNIVAAGSSDAQYATVRYSINGSPDLTFGVNGILLTTFGTNDQNNSSVIELFDGRLVSGGDANTSGQAQSTLLRYNKNNTDFININSISSGNINTKIPIIAGISSGSNSQVQVFINGNLFTTVNTDPSGNWDAGHTSVLPVGNNLIVVKLFNGSNYIVGDAINLNVVDNFSEDSLFAYNTTAQTSTSTSYVAVPFNNLPTLGTWTYANSKFTCNKTGTYVFQYAASAGVSGSITNSTTSVDVATSIFVNQTEYLGSEADVSIDLNTLLNRTVSRSFIKSLNAGDTISLEFAIFIVGASGGFHVGLMTSPHAIGTQPSYSLSITRIG